MTATPIPRAIGILGAGAMGTMFGVRLAGAGCAVTMVDVDDAVLAALRRDGARCTIDGAVRRARVDAVRAEQLHQGPPLWLVFTKSAHTRAALEGIRHLIGPTTHFLSLQNGIGHAEVLLAFAAPSRVAVGVTTWPARLNGPGDASSSGRGAIRFMPCDGRRNAVFDDLAADLDRAGLDCRVDPQVQQAIWEKLAFNAAVNGVCALTRRSVDALATVAGRDLLGCVLGEVLAVARAEGVAVDAARVHATVHDALAQHVGHQPSMLQDVLAGRATEVEAIHGAVVRAADRLGIAVPVTRTLHRLIRLGEGTEGTAGRAPAAASPR